MVINKSPGVTPTERLLATLCDQSFLQLWSYPNPFKDDGHELCDVLAVFEQHVFIFFDREIELVDTQDKDPVVRWDRWRRKVIDAQIKTAHGAERYIKSGRPAFLDSRCQTPFPISIDASRSVFHKIVVAHGAKEACERFSDANVYGSLGITYGRVKENPPFPFMIDLDRANPVHVFDSHNLPILLSELDTIADFSNYLDAKLDAVRKLDMLGYCGEEDLLAHYLKNIDTRNQKHFIGTSEPNINGVMIGEGEWKDFVSSDLYKNTKRANQVSYVWDELLRRTCQNELDGKLLGDSILAHGRSALHEMAKEPRFSRRALSAEMLRVIRNFPEPAPGAMLRNLTFMPSFYAGKGYVFLQMAPTDEIRSDPDYRSKRQSILEIACGAAKNWMSQLSTVVGIAMDAPKYNSDTAEDFVLMDVSAWPDDRRTFYEEKNEGWDFFRSRSLKQTRRTVTEFVPAPGKKVGRNQPCPCGSGRKYKKCCLAR
jgi:hypothetical protein